jgi:hypothetical protein
VSYPRIRFPLGGDRGANCAYSQNTKNDSKGHSSSLPASDRLFIETKKKIFKMRLWSKFKPRMLLKKTSGATETTPTKGPETSTNDTNVPLFRTPIQRGRDLATNADSGKSIKPTKGRASGPQNSAKPNCLSSTIVRPRALSDNNCMNMNYGILTSEQYTKLVMSNKRFRPIFLDSISYNAC